MRLCLGGIVIIHDQICTLGRKEKKLSKRGETVKNVNVQGTELLCVKHFAGVEVLKVII